MTKTAYPKCPYCKELFLPSQNDYNFGKLVKLATEGWVKETEITCPHCYQPYRVRCNVNFTGSKL